MTAPDADLPESDPDTTAEDAPGAAAAGTATGSHGSAPPARPTPATRREIPWRLVALAVLLVYGILFVILNSKEVSVSFVFFTPKVSLIVALVLALLIGFLAGYLFDTMRDRKRRPGTKTPAGTP